MSTTPTTSATGPVTGPPAGVERRVRHQAQDVMAVMAFSGLLSCACAVALLLLTQLGR